MNMEFLSFDRDDGTHLRRLIMEMISGVAIFIFGVLVGGVLTLKGLEREKNGEKEDTRA